MVGQENDRAVSAGVQRAPCVEAFGVGGRAPTPGGGGAGR